jgi:elongation factor Ts
MSTTDISAKDVMALRKKTGLGMMDCKKALVEHNGDTAAAEAALREKLKGKMDDRVDRAAGEGRIVITTDGDKATIVEFRAETDFTTRNDAFVAMSNMLTAMTFDQGDGDTQFTDDMKKILDEVRITTGENISMARGHRLTGGSFGTYIHHDNKLGVLLQFEGDLPDDIATGICQHVAAYIPTPMAVNEAGVPEDLVAAKTTEARAEAENSGKPPEIAEKIAAGKMRKFFEEVTLLGQKYVRDDSKMVKELLPEGVTLKAFVRFQVGEEA